MWLVWLILATISVWLFWTQVWAWFPGRDDMWLAVLLAAIHFPALAITETVAGKEGRLWWLRSLLLAGVLVDLIIPAIALVVAPAKAELSIQVGAFAWAVVMVVYGRFYLRERRDVRSLSLLALSLCIVLLFVAGKILFDLLGIDDAWGLLFIGLISVGLFGAAAKLLFRFHRSLREEESRG